MNHLIIIIPAEWRRCLSLSGRPLLPPAANRMRQINNDNNNNNNNSNSNSNNQSNNEAPSADEFVASSRAAAGLCKSKARRLKLEVPKPLKMWLCLYK